MTALTRFTHLASSFEVLVDLTHDGSLRVELTLCDASGDPWHSIIAFRQGIPWSMEVLVDAVIDAMQAAESQDEVVHLFKSSDRWFTSEQYLTQDIDWPLEYQKTAKESYARIVADGLGMDRF